MAKAKKQPAKTSKGLYQAHSPGLKQFAKQSHAELREQQRKQWHKDHNETH